MITVYESYVEAFKHIAELLDSEGMTPTEIAKTFLTYVVRKEVLCQKK